MELHKSFFLEEAKVSWWLRGRGNSDLFWKSSFIGLSYSVLLAWGAKRKLFVEGLASICVLIIGHVLTNCV